MAPGPNPASLQYGFEKSFLVHSIYRNVYSIYHSIYRNVYIISHTSAVDNNVITRLVYIPVHTV